jgi:hypothetical protein
MAAIYQATLDEIERDDYRVLTSASRCRRCASSGWRPKPGSRHEACRRRRRLCRHGRSVELAAAGPRGRRLRSLAPRSAAAPARRRTWRSHGRQRPAHPGRRLCETLRLMRAVGADPDPSAEAHAAALRVPRRIPDAGAATAGALAHRIRPAAGQGLDWREKLAAIRLMRGLQAECNYRVAPDRTVTPGWMNRKTPSRQRRLLWEPLCIAALNTPAERASAQVLANVLRDSLGGAREASDMLLPQVDLTALFPGTGGRLSSGSAAAASISARASPSLRREGDAWRIDAAGPFDQVVLAVAPYHLGALLPELAIRRATFRVGTHCHQLLQLPRHGAPAAAHAGRRWRPRAMAVRPRPALRPARSDRRRHQRARPPHLELPTAELEQASTPKSPASCPACHCP